MKKVSFLRAAITNYLDGDGTPYVSNWLVGLDSVQQFLDEHCCFRLGDSVEFSGYETFEFSAKADIPGIIKRS